MFASWQLSPFLLMIMLHFVSGRQGSFDSMPTLLNNSSFEGPRDKACEICQVFSAEASKILSDPETTEQAILLIESAFCINLPPVILPKCQKAVREYVPQVISMLLEKVDAGTLCVSTNICVTPVLDSAESTISVQMPQSSVSCEICIEVASEILVLLESGKTQEEILALLHKTCQHIKAPSFEKKCDILVDTYFPQLIAIVETVTPQEACSVAHYCSADQAKETMQQILTAKQEEAAVDASPKECLACRFLVSQARRKLKDPGNQALLEKYLMEACENVSDFVDECKTAVLEYLPELFANIDLVVDPTKICTKVNMCMPPKASQRPRVEVVEGLAQV